MTRKRIDFVSIKMVKESSALYNIRKIACSSDCYTIFKPLLENSDREKLLVCCLNTKNEPTNISVVSIGSLNSSIVSPREVFKTAILSNAASLILAHNHPSGDTTPSKEEIKVTLSLKESGKILGIKLIDHIIIGDDYTSLNEQGYL